jgi:hypothetical protein
VTRESAVTANLAASFITLSPSILALLLYVPYSTLNRPPCDVKTKAHTSVRFSFPTTLPSYTLHLAVSLLLSSVSTTFLPAFPAVTQQTTRPAGTSSPTNRN